MVRHLHFPLFKLLGTRFLRIPVNFGARKAVYICCICIQDLSFNCFENDTMKLSVNEAKLTGFAPGTVLLFNRFLFQNLPSGPKSYRAFRETGPWTGLFKSELG